MYITATPTNPPHRYPITPPPKHNKNNLIQHPNIPAMYQYKIQPQPVATLVQFRRLANVYFLITAILQFIPVISPLSPISAIAPLIFVIMVSLIRAAVEEIGKYRYDREANSSKFLVYVQHDSDQDQQQEQIAKVSGEWQLRRSDQLHVGDIIKINQDQRFPADIIILNTSNPDGKAYIETSSLDGQKNLKIRTTLPSTQPLYSTTPQPCFPPQKPLLTIEQPTEQLYSFNAMLQLTSPIAPNSKPPYGMKLLNARNNRGEHKITEFVKINQFLYREAVLRNTDHVVGVVVYAGRYTKSMMNSTGGRQKMSQLERRINFYMVFIFLLQLVLIILCGILRVFLFYNTQTSQNFSTQILLNPPRNPLVEATLTSCSYFILLNTMIPISLLVSIQIVKFGQGIFIGCDRLMSRKDQKDGKVTFARAFRSSINQELGMVEYVFTDKTGTLTRNQMGLREVGVGGQVYANQWHSKTKQEKEYYFNSMLQQQSARTLSQFNSFLRNLSQLTKPSSAQSPIPILLPQHKKSLNTLMLLIMSTCHQCLLQLPNPSQSSPSSPTSPQPQPQPKYHGSSPDEITLVDSSARCGYQFLQNRFDIISIKLGDGNVVKMKVEGLVEFNSDRKRMTIVLSMDGLGDQVVVFCKGADSSVDGLLRAEYRDNRGTLQYECYKKIKEKITQNSKTGLRTLLFGYKLMPTSKYKLLKQKLLPSTSPIPKQPLLQQLEHPLQLCGTTSVQDKLQQNVQQVIEDLIKANIKVCMLTGDKLQTAENIAKSCRLFGDDWKIVRIGEGSGDYDVFRGYCQVREIVGAGGKFGVVVEGSAINTAINSIYFSEMFQHSSASVCCRITPKNKSQMVQFTKNHLKKLVLAIGDGANDVPMIQSANIGIGLYGNEGMNAVQASDFALPEFQALWRLLFVHGRWNYIRIAELIKYFFYKNMVFTLGQLWFAYLCGFSGTSIYNATYLVLFNTIFTGGPVLVRALLEQDLNYIQIIKEINHEQEQQQKHTKKQLKEQLLVDQHKSVAPSLQSPSSSPSTTTTKTTLKLSIDPTLKSLFPQLYTHSQHQQSLTPTLFLFLILQSILQSFFIFLTIYFGIEAPQLWIYSICLYSVILGLVTIRICYDIRYWTWVMVAVVVGTSVGPYVGFVWVMGRVEGVLWGTFGEIVGMVDFYLCLGLALGVGAFIQATFNIITKYYFPTPTDLVRQQYKQLQSQSTSLHRQSYRSSIKSKYNEILVQEKHSRGGKRQRQEGIGDKHGIQMVEIGRRK